MTAVTEQYGQLWSSKMEELLFEIKTQKDLSITKGEVCLSKYMLDDYFEKYNKIIEIGIPKRLKQSTTKENHPS
jgi:hypothetical protein